MVSLGVIDSVLDNNQLRISYFIRKDKKGIQWVFPEEADVQDTLPEQILMKVVNVAYHCVSRIRCFIDAQIVDQINEKVREINNKKTI